MVNYISYVYVERDDDGELYTTQIITNPGGGTLSLTLAEGDIYIWGQRVSISTTLIAITIICPIFTSFRGNNSFC